MLYTLKASRQEAIAEGVLTQETGVTVDAQGQVLLDITAKVSPPLLKYINRLGGEVVASYPDYGHRSYGGNDWSDYSHDSP